MAILLLDRDGDGEHRFLFLFRFHAYVAAVVEHDLPAQIHTHSYRLCGGLGGEEGVEYLVQSQKHHRRTDACDARDAYPRLLR